MENLEKLAVDLLEEADDIAEHILKTGELKSHVKNIDIIENICDIAHKICIAVEIHEKFDGGEKSSWADNPRSRRRM